MAEIESVCWLKCLDRRIASTSCAEVNLNQRNRDVIRHWRFTTEDCIKLKSLYPSITLNH